MEFDLTREDDKLTITISGEIDSGNADELEQCVLDNLDGVNELILDMKDVEYIASAGLRVILMARKTLGKNKVLRIVNAQENVMEIFEMVGFLEIITFE